MYNQTELETKALIARQPSLCTRCGHKFVQFEEFVHSEEHALHGICLSCLNFLKEQAKEGFGVEADMAVGEPIEVEKSPEGSAYVGPFNRPKADKGAATFPADAADAVVGENKDAGERATGMFAPPPKPEADDGRGVGTVNDNALLEDTTIYDKEAESVPFEEATEVAPENIPGAPKVNLP